MPVVKGYARKSKATRYAGGYLLFEVNYTIMCNTLQKKMTVHINLCYNKFTRQKITRRNI